MAQAPQINYLNRDFTTIRQDLITYLKAFYPDQWQDFNVASPGMALLDLNAYIGDLLSYATDKRYNELFLDGLAETKSAYRMAKTFGYKIPGFRPAVTIADIIIEVPATADGPNIAYLPLIRPGMQIKGAGQIFETIAEIDFSNDFSADGIANRTIEPILNGNQDIIRYRLVKREKIKAGVTKIFKKEISATEAVPFFQVSLTETNVLEVTDVIVFNGQLGITRTPTFQEFNDFNLRYWEVEDLPDDKVFLNDDSQLSQNTSVSVGRYVEVEQRFTKEFLADGSCSLMFGGGAPDYDAYNAFITSLTGQKCQPNDLNISQILNNTALGKTVPANSTLFIKYRVGGGPSSNVGANTLQEVSNVDAVMDGPDPVLAQNVISSIRANNPIPAIGGVGLPSVSEIKNHIAANFASQKRCVTLEDYIATAYQMPGKYGAPFRIHGTVEDNKIKMYILTRDGNGNLLSISTSEIKNNLLNFLAPFRMINDFVEINDGKVVNLQIEIDLFIDRNFNPSEIKTNAIQRIADFFNVENWEMNQNIYTSQVTEILREVPGVINVVDVRFFNMEGGGYSNTLSSQIGNNKLQTLNGGFRTNIDLIDNTIFGTSISMFEIKFTDKDILVRVA